MTDEQAFKPVVIFNDNETNEANKKILNRMASAMFSFFAPDDDDISDDELDNLYREIGGMSTVAMAVAGMQIIGENINGDYVVSFDPYKSFDDFSQKNSIR